MNETEKKNGTTKFLEKYVPNENIKTANRRLARRQMRKNGVFKRLKYLKKHQEVLKTLNQDQIINYLNTGVLPK